MKNNQQGRQSKFRHKSFKVSRSLDLIFPCVPSKGEIPVRKNVGKIMQNVDSRRLTIKSAKLTCHPILQIQS